MIITPTEDHVTGDEILDKSDNDDDNDDMIHGTVSKMSSGQHWWSSFTWTLQTIILSLSDDTDLITVSHLTMDLFN